MGELWSIAWGAARLETAAFARWQARHSLAGGLALLFAVSLLVGGPDGALWTQAHLGQRSPWSSREQRVASLDEWLYRSPLPPDAQHELTRNLAAWLELQAELEGLPRPLGHQASCVVQGLGRVVSTPYRRLAVWLPYSLLVFALAKALGGRASLPEMLSTSTLYVVPHILDLLRPLPGLGPIVGALTFLWGAAIFVKATAVANDLDAPRAFLAATLPALTALTLAMLALSVVAVMS